ncbi:hypothetical protein ACFL1L_00900 [Thermoplasmatota archaeon]
MIIIRKTLAFIIGLLLVLIIITNSIAISQNTEINESTAYDIDRFDKINEYFKQITSESFKRALNLYYFPDYVLNSGTCGQQTSDGGYIIGGYTGYRNSVEVIDVANPILIKTDNVGEEEWRRIYSFNNKGYNMLLSLQQTMDNGYILSGYKTDGWYDSNAYLIKTGENGDEQWRHYYAGDGYSLASDAVKTNDNGYALIGATLIPNSDETKSSIFFIKTDEEGNEQWNKKYLFKDFNIGYSLKQTSDGGYIVSGTCINISKNIEDSNLYNYELVVFKIDKNGNILWYKFFKFLDTLFNSELWITKDEGVVITGFSYSFGAFDTSLYQTYLIKLDLYGNLEWEKIFGSQNDYIYGSSVVQTDDEGYIICGALSTENESYAMLLKTDNLGNQEWIKTYPELGLSNGYHMDKTNDNGYLLIGHKNEQNITSDYMTYMLLLKTDVDGNEEWNRLFFEMRYTTLEIEFINNSIVVRNIGDYDAYDLQIKLSMSGFVFGGISRGIQLNFDKFLIDEEITIRLGFFFGLGKIQLEISVDAVNAPEVTKIIEGHLILFFLFIDN